MKEVQTKKERSAGKECRRKRTITFAVFFSPSKKQHTYSTVLFIMRDIIPTVCIYAYHVQYYSVSGGDDTLVVGFIMYHTCT